MAQFTSGMIVYAADVDGTTTASTPIFTAPQGFAISEIQAILKTVSGLSIVCTLSIGTNASSYNNIKSAVALTGLSAANSVLQISTPNPVAIVNTGETVYAKVTIASTATTYDLQIVIIGYPV